MPEATLPPKHLAEALENAVLGSKDKYPLNTTIEVAIDQGELRTCGFTRYTGIIDRRPLDSSEGVGSLLLDYEDVAAFCKDDLRKMKGFANKGAMVRIELNDESLKVMDGTNVLGTLEKSEDAERYEGDAEHEGFYEYLLGLEADSEPLGTMRYLRLVKESVLRLKDIKMSTMDDGKWVAAQATDAIDMYALTDAIIGIEYGTARVIQALAGIIELEE